MSVAKIFISHTSADDLIVKEIREGVEGQGLPVWGDSRELTGGDDLNDEVFERIEQARHFILVQSPPAISSTWVAEEINHALWIRKKRTDGYKVIRILLDGSSHRPSVLGLGRRSRIAYESARVTKRWCKHSPSCWRRWRDDIDPSAMVCSGPYNAVRS